MNGSETELGVLLPNAGRVTHGSGGNIKKPFDHLPVIMHELHVGASGDNGTSFHGQFGLIPFATDFRLPRHVHMAEAADGRAPRLIAERILVVAGVALVELNGDIVLVAPNSLIEIDAGVPHTWTACAPGVTLPDETVSNGSFLMIYDYPERTRFYPTASTLRLADAAAYEPYVGDLETIRFPQLDAADVVARASFVWDRQVRRDLRLAR